MTWYLSLGKIVLIKLNFNIDGLDTGGIISIDISIEKTWDELSDKY